jgi:hypothetical protein
LMQIKKINSGFSIYKKVIVNRWIKKVTFDNILY